MRAALAAWRHGGLEAARGRDRCVQWILTFVRMTESQEEGQGFDRPVLSEVEGLSPNGGLWAGGVA
jgi:hypothetical protein